LPDNTSALLAAAAAHLGFQATVTAVVYPALARVPAPQWMDAHRAHSRAITPVVAAVYGSLLLTGAWALWSGPSPWTWLTLTATAAAMLVTAVAAAPAHGRLGAGHDPRHIRFLLRADRLRTLTAAIALVAALAAAH
jgi:tetrahydromethanopterin S-methyltransferase subunit E